MKSKFEELEKALTALEFGLDLYKKEFYRTTTCVTINEYRCGTEYRSETFRATRKARLQAYRKIMCETMKLIKNNFRL